MIKKNELINDKEFERFLEDSFDDGRVNCELRLSDIEVEYIQKKYRESTILPLSDKICDKNWYIVCLGLY